MGWDGPLTQRQHEAWLAWLELDMSCPTRADYYMMQIARFLLADANKVKLDDLRIPLPTDTQERKSERQPTKTEILVETARAKSASLRRVGMVPQVGEEDQ